MIFILLRDGTSTELPDTFDVIHKNGWIECIDPWGGLIASFLTDDVLAYSLNPRVVREFSADGDPPHTNTARTQERVGQASAKMRISSQDIW
jgi:hypothetical protein